MKKITLLVLLIFLLSGCKSFKNVSSKNNLDIIFNFSKDKINKLSYPENLKKEKLVLPQEINDLTDLAKAIDTALLINNNKMTYYNITSSLSKLAKEDENKFLKDVMYLTPLAHNFFVASDGSKLDQNKYGIHCALKDDYATLANPYEPLSKTINYLFYQNSLNKEHVNYKLSDLPLYKNNDGFLEVKNSEELFYAILHNYFPIVSKNSSAEKILSLALTILNNIISLNASEYDIYEAIYNYVISSNQYDYVTIKNKKVKIYQNRSYYLEGSLLDRVSVCDGLAKEVIFLSRLMGIEAYYIGAYKSNNYDKDKGHAYIYLKLNGKYYLSCPTRCLQHKKISGKDYAYHTMSYFLTDLNTNDSDWVYNSLAYPQIKKQIKDSYDYWNASRIKVEQKELSLKPTNLKEALQILKIVKQTSEELKCNMEIELCGDISLLKDAYLKMKKETKNLVFMATGTYKGKRLQTYLFKGE